jgi:hypothetical protein
VKLQTLQAVVAATLVCVGTPSIAQQPYYYGQPARSTQGPDSRVYQYPTMYAALADDGGPVEQTTLEGTDQLTYNDYYAEGPTPADGSAAPAGTGSAAAGSGGGSCCGSGSGCNTCCDPCCNSVWGHCTGLFAEALFLRPRGADVPFAVVHNGVDPATFTSFGTVATANPDFSFGYRGGAVYGLNQVSSIQASYTYFQSETNGSIFTAPPLSIHSLVTDPHTFTAASDSLAALARYTVRFQFVDVDYRRLLAGGRNWGVNYSIGTRYAQLTELFRSSQPIGPGVTNVGTNVKFDGMGARAGLQGTRKMANRGFLIYGQGFASVLPGNARASYLQTNNFAGTQVANSWKDFRTVSILEFEVGSGWQNASGRLRISAGYYFAVWFNTLGTNDYIQAVQTNDYVNRNSAITFDGLTTRLQYVW